MFKKRARPVGVRDKSKVEEAGDVPQDEADVPDEEEQEEGRSIEDLIMLRKLRKAKQGIDLEKLNRGEDKKGKRKKDEDPSLQGYGLQSRNNEEVDEELEDDHERAKRLVRSNNFTQQTNALDVDRHMLAYIEEELAKRRGNLAKEGEEITKPYDPQAELYKVPERYDWAKTTKREDEEGNVTNSMGMLTSIPEVDLGMDNRLKNIEETEKAKRDMMEQRKAAAIERKKAEDEDFAAARFHRPNQRVASDIYALHDAQNQKNGQESRPPRRDGPRHEAATDEQVYERFKKRMKR